jgi:anoctamin-8
MAPTRTISQPVSIPEIPPFRKSDHQHSNYPPPPQSATSHSMSTASTSVSPPKISDIPPFNKHRKSKDSILNETLTINTSQDGSHPEHQLTIGPTGGAEWTRRLKVAEQSPIHRSTDCIVTKELGTSSDSELLKPAPSWTNVALKTTEHAGTSKF